MYLCTDLVTPRPRFREVDRNVESDMQEGFDERTREGWKRGDNLGDT